MAKQKQIGEVTHYFSKIGVAVVKLEAPIKNGATVRFKGATTDFSQSLDSLQVDHKPVDRANKGESIGVKVNDRVRVGDKVLTD